MESDILKYLDRDMRVMVICPNAAVAVHEMRKIRDQRPTRVYTGNPPTLYYSNAMVTFRTDVTPDKLCSWNGMILFHPFYPYKTTADQLKRHQKLVEIANSRNERVGVKTNKLEEPNKKRPEGLYEYLKSRIHWILDPEEADKVWNFLGKKENVRVDYIRQHFRVVLMDGNTITKQLDSETSYSFGSELLSAEDVHDIRVRNFLERAGKYGVRLKNEFYPQSNIYKIISQEPITWTENKNNETT